jgi:hypothetical protein
LLVLRRKLLHLQLRRHLRLLLGHWLLWQLLRTLTVAVQQQLLQLLLQLLRMPVGWRHWSC